jgi:colanic acid/amylovoran biosynthesis glycosyltransferase
MKVTFCAYDFPGYVGGPVTWLRFLSTDLRELGLEPKVLCAAKDGGGHFVSGLRSEGIAHTITPWPIPTPRLVRWILDCLSTDPPDVFVPNLMVPAYYAAQWIRAAGIPTVGVLHSDDPFHHALVDAFITGRRKWRLSAVACVSEFLTGMVRSKRPKGVEVRRVPYGVSVPEAVVNPAGARFRVAYVGRLVQTQKRITDVVRALLRVVREVEGTEAVIFGDGPERQRVENQLRHEGAGLAVRLVGAVSPAEIQAHLLSCHALVLLSDYEGLPIALMEAMACGTVPICTQMRSGIPELVADRVSGFVVPGRGDSVVAAVRELRRDSDLWSRLSTAARARITSGFSRPLAANAWHDLLVSLANSSGRRSLIRQPLTLRLPTPRTEFLREDLRAPWVGRRAAGKVWRLATRFLGTE